MSAYINRWVLLAALAGHAAATGPLAARAESPDRMQGSAPYALADALMPYAQRDYARALELPAPLAEQGNAVAQLKLGIIFSRGKVNSPDPVAALRWFTKAAENGQVEAQFELGRIYRDGLGTQADGKLAVYWLERAAEKNTTRSALSVSYTLDTATFRRISPSQEAGSCAARRSEIPHPCTISAFSMRVDKASCRTTSRRSSGSSSRPTRE